MIHRKPLRLVCFISMVVFSIANNAFSQIWNPGHAVGTITGKYHYAYNQTADQLVELSTAGYPTTGQTFQWESSTTPNEVNFAAVTPNGAQYSSYNPGTVTQTRYYRRKTTNIFQQTVYSNIVKISLVSANWEDRNYIREHDVQIAGVTTFQAVDQLPIGQKFQNTSYLDGLGRKVQTINKGTAAPAAPGGLWGDVVQFAEFDALGRQPKLFLPYTTTNQPGKYKTGAVSEQAGYYTSVYNETSAFTTIDFYSDPLDRVKLSKSPGTVAHASQGSWTEPAMNTIDDAVRIFSIDYVQGAAPVSTGVYPPNTLYKLVSIDKTEAIEKKVIEYTDMDGKLILRKIQLDDSPSAAHTGWICLYRVYDDMNVLRCQLQPEAVKYLEANSWSFAGTNGQQVLNEYCFQYYYDNKGRVIWKKTPGTAAIYMVYDARDRLVFTQDGNQRTLSTPQWTAKIYDELDRPVITTLYNTFRNATTLQTDINNAATNTTVTIANTGSYTVTAATHKNPIPNADLNNSSINTVLGYEFYDDYSFAAAKPFNTNFSNHTAYSPASDPNNILPIAASKRVSDFHTGSMTRVLGTNTFLTTTRYYSEKGLFVQSLSDNIKSGTDISTWQFHFDGRMLSSCFDLNTTSADITHYVVLNKYNFDQIGRIASVQKQFGTNAFRTILSCGYDDFGRIKVKRLDPDYASPSGNGLETLNYSFNLNGQLTGINKDYALKDPSTYNKWSHFFGMHLGFDNKDNIFAKARLNGQVTGVVWNTQGDDAQRKYDYNYDNAGRLVSALFNEQQHPGEGWASNKMDFSVTGTNGKITYDLNGNLLNMLQKGVQPGNAAPITIDNLNYTYASLSNKLQSIADQTTATSVNGKFGDFKDGTNGSAPDYVYDNNGNLVIDLNKNAKDLGNVAGANGIKYNHLDKPEQIRLAGKGTINIKYTADGEKLQQVFTPESGLPTTTTYVGQFVYQATGGNGDALSFINFEDGRIRVIQPVAQDNGYDGLAIAGNLVLPLGKAGVYDYFVRDNQQNVRMVLTEELHNAYNICTMESGRATVEEPLFGQTGGANEVATTRQPKPAGWNNAAVGTYASRVGNIAGHNLGPNTLQKVMAGDDVSAAVLYYHQNSAGGSNPNLVNTLLTSLGQTIAGGGVAGSLVKGNVAGVTSGLNGSSGFVNAVQNAGTGGTTPKAWLTVLFFDERFKFVEAADGGVWQQQVAATVSSGGDQLAGSIKAPKNGYAYVYVSNESDQDVYFDNLRVGISRGNIIEENHYYAYGLKIAGISSSKPAHANEGQVKNNYLYNDKELFDDGDLNWYDYGFRNYDPQTGRFVQVDPLTDHMPALSGFHYAYNDPVTNVDADGLIGIPCPGTSAFSIFLGNAASAITNSISALSPVINVMNPVVNVTASTLFVENSVQGSNRINGQITTLQAGLTTGPTTTGTPDAMKAVNSPKGRLITKGGRMYVQVRPSNPSTWSKLLKYARVFGTKPLTTIGLVLLPVNYFDDPNVHPERQWEVNEMAKKEDERRELEEVGDDKDKKKDIPWRYVTYTKIKFNEDGTFVVYSGRTSGPATMTAAELVAIRDKQHAGIDNLVGYEPAVVDREAVGKRARPDPARWQIRGREQQLIDYWGRAQWEIDANGMPGTSGNKIRGVWKYNLNGRAYHQAASLKWGELFRYTGGFK